jgi:hypothetical protein
MLVFLQRNQIMDFAGLEKKVSDMFGKLLSLGNELKPINRRIATLDEHINNYMGDEAHISIRNAKIAKSLATDAVSPWWLRSPGHYGDIAAYVTASGSIGVDGGDVGRVACGFRPALWLTL